MSGPICSACERGMLIRRKVYRLSTPWVAFGYALLILSFAALVFAVCYYLANRSENEESVKKQKERVAEFKKTKDKAAVDLKKAEVPEAVIAKVVDMKEVSAEEMAGLSDGQKAAVKTQIT